MSIQTLFGGHSGGRPRCPERRRSARRRRAKRTIDSRGADALGWTYQFQHGGLRLAVLFRVPHQPPRRCGTLALSILVHDSNEMPWANVPVRPASRDLRHTAHLRAAQAVFSRKPAHRRARSAARGVGEIASPWRVHAKGNSPLVGRFGTVLSVSEGACRPPAARTGLPASAVARPRNANNETKRRGTQWQMQHSES